MSTKKLYRSKQDKVIAGVCGGIAEYFNIDTILIRLFAVLLVLADGIGVIMYIIAWVVIPENPLQKDVKKVVEKAEKSSKKKDGHGTILLGLLIVIIGAILLLKNIFSWINTSLIWAALLIVLGLYLIGRKSK
ncbi:PspC domain-containing protein [Candidatus Woesearchaeota archaeon]|nr:PspC domain-containing protein [Candidatus Woesearchaeota archaeon]